ncbi:helix-turn-helix transcriptional regulator [uncultured Microbacterium sp.]|uniref:helix-turn-helix transcriptional regulator n=1 Tax=uncultured Microbacterium sp. TaxID=191216 RepID=UPI0028D8C3A8|nr:helix-turn-helix transcriptional regulator [uncultured Microbacterium sp.]
MENKPEVRDFLMSRRSRVTPEQVGLPAFGNRRVAGLRRNEVAALAGVSVEYYTRVERGNLQGVSNSVLDAIASALRMNETERAHLHDLGRLANTSPVKAPRRTTKPTTVPAVVKRVVDGMPGLPAFVQNNRFDVLYANPLGRALFSEMFDDASCRGNTVRFVFFSPAARRFYRDWERIARTAVGSLRVEAGKNPYDTELSNLIGELSTRSDTFRVLWGANDVGAFSDGTKSISHPVVGDLQLEHSAMVLPGATDLLMTVYSAAPGSTTEDGLALLASWAATNVHDPAVASTER